MAKGSEDLLRGTLDALILKALSWGPRHGYGVAAWIKDTSRATLAVEEAPRLAEIAGTVPSLKDAIPGCPFEARCSFATDICRREMPEFAEKEPGHFAACFHSDRVAEA